MGYYYSELVPPAILFDNPGITASKFSDSLLRGNIASGSLYAIEPAYTLPRVLGLPTQESFSRFQQSKIDEQGILLAPPIAFLFEPFTVRAHIKNELLPPKIHENIELEEIEDSQLTHLNGDGYWHSDSMCLVNRILSKTKRKLPSDHPFYASIGLDRRCEILKYKFICQEIKEVVEEQIFDSENELFEKWPQFKPENRFDFSIQNGVFSSVNILGDNFRWKQINGRYYFDEISFDLMPAGGYDVRGQGVGYTDLVLTSEIIKYTRVDLLGYNARDGKDEKRIQMFIENLPEDSKERIKKSIRDSHLSISAKNRGLTTFDLIHLRVDPNFRQFDTISS